MPLNATSSSLANALCILMLGGHFFLLQLRFSMPTPLGNLALAYPKSASMPALLLASLSKTLIESRRLGEAVCICIFGSMCNASTQEVAITHAFAWLRCSK